MKPVQQARDPRKRFEQQHAKALRRLSGVERNTRRYRQNLSPNERFRRLRLGELRKLFTYRWGPHLPPDDAGHGDLKELFYALAMGQGDVVAAMVEEASLRAPWMPKNEAKALAEEIAELPSYLLKSKADKLGRRLRLTTAERDLLDIRTIAPYNSSKAKRELARKRRKKINRARARRANGVKCRAEYEAKSLSKTQPWKALGISRRTWERRRRRVASAGVVASVGPISLQVTGTALATGGESAKGPAGKRSGPAARRARRGK
jgi:hypothetical protein